MKLSIHKLTVFNGYDVNLQINSQQRQPGRPRPLSVGEAKLFDEQENNHESTDSIDSENGMALSPSTSFAFDFSKNNFHENKKSHDCKNYNFYDCDEQDSTYVDMSGVNGVFKEKLTSPLLQNFLPRENSQLNCTARGQSEHTILYDPSGATVKRKNLTAFDHPNHYGDLYEAKSHRYNHNGRCNSGAIQHMTNINQREYDYLRYLLFYLHFVRMFRWFQHEFWNFSFY